MRVLQNPHLTLAGDDPGFASAREPGLLAVPVTVLPLALWGCTSPGAGITACRWLRAQVLQAENPGVSSPPLPGTGLPLDTWLHVSKPVFSYPEWEQ